MGGGSLSVSFLLFFTFPLKYDGSFLILDLFHLCASGSQNPNQADVTNLRVNYLPLAILSINKISLMTIMKRCKPGHAVPIITQFLSSTLNLVPQISPLIDFTIVCIYY